MIKREREKKRGTDNKRTSRYKLKEKKLSRRIKKQK
jgi:hypothetical protein